MSISRRQLLATGGAAAAAAVAAPAIGGLGSRPKVAWAAGCSEPMPGPRSRAHHLLSRATYGVTRAELAHIEQVGTQAWIEEQLAYDRLDDGAVEAALDPLESLSWTPEQIKANGFGQGRPVSNELVAGTLYREVASRRQLYEIMVDLWSNQFNVWHPEELVSRTKTVDDREVFRKHALGKFRDLVHGSSASTSMMRFLNTVRNTRSGPNENFPRELMELHVLGVDGGYTEEDVKQVALCFTGWNYSNDTWRFQFRAGDHALGNKTVLGKRIAESGADEGRAVIDHLVDQPACATHVARKLCQRFVADDPPTAIIIRVAGAFGQDGDIKAMLRTLFASPEFWDAWRAPADGSTPYGPAKIRRPADHWAGVMRALEVDASPLLREIPSDAYEETGVDYYDRAEAYLQQMDHLPFRWHAPDGYPERGPWWSGMHVMLGRWNYAYDLAAGNLWGMTPDLLGQMRRDGLPFSAAEIVDYWAERILSRPMSVVDRQRLILFISQGSAGALPETELRQRLPMLVALLFDSPYYQWR